MLNADVEVDRRDFAVRVAFAVAPGERLALFGPSGAGKTTILEAIAGLVLPRQGTVELGGRVLTRTSAPRRAGAAVAPPGRPAPPGPGPVPAPVGPAEPDLRARRGDPRRRDRPDRRAGSASAGCSATGRPGCPAARRTGSRSAGCCWRTATRCSSTSRTPGWTPHSAATSPTWSATWSRRARCRPSWWHTSWTPRRRSPTGSPCWTRARSCRKARRPRWSPAPASRRVAELVGYRSFVPVPRPAESGTVAGVHPDRVTAGAQPEPWAGADRPGPVLPPGRGRLGGRHRGGRDHPDRAAAGQAAGRRRVRRRRRQRSGRGRAHPARPARTSARTVPG